MLVDYETLLNNCLSGEEAKDYVREIALHHRVHGSPGFHEAVEYVKWILENIGLDVKIDTRPLNGEFKIWTWEFPLAWNITSAELSVIHPEERLVTSFDENAVCVYNKSAGTPREGVVGELIYVEEGLKDSDYSDLDVDGKIVLANGPGEDVANLAVRKYGALGVITNFLRPHPPVKTRKGTPDLIQDSSIRAIDKKLWVFSISYNHFKYLKNLLDRGKVEVRIKINAEFIDDGVLETIVAKIPGTKLADEEILVIPHICHHRPGANDNASGVGVAVELAKVIQQAIDKGDIERPLRTITFIMGAEMYGALSYLDRNWSRRSKLVGGFCLDMLGEDQEKTKAGVEISSIPDSFPNFLNDHIKTLFEDVERKALYFQSNANRTYKYDAKTVNFRYNVSQFTPGSDHLIFDDSSVGIPVIQFGHWPDIYYHSSGDVIEMVSPEELKRNGTALGIALLNLANAGEKQAHTFINHVYTQTLKRISDNSGRARDQLYKLETKKEIGDFIELECKRIDFLVDRDIEGLKSVKKFISHESKENIEKINALIDGLVENIIQTSKMEKDSLRNYCSSLYSIDLNKIERKKEKTKYISIIPKRKYIGSLSAGQFVSKLSAERRDQYREWATQGEKEVTFSKLNAKIVEGWSLSDGKRSIMDISEALTFEYSPTDPNMIYEIFKDLEKHDYLTLTSK
jgi:aminopeptidase YwaD